jgi:hypothetical protein
MIYNFIRYSEADNKRTRLRLRTESLDPNIRLEVYKEIATNLIKSKRNKISTGFCTCFPDEYKTFDYTRRICMFPELHSKKPSVLYENGWWLDPRDWVTRIKIIKDVINETKELINNER